MSEEHAQVLHHARLGSRVEEPVQPLLDNQADAAVASQAITQVVDAARTGTPLK